MARLPCHQPHGRAKRQWLDLTMPALRSPETACSIRFVRAGHGSPAAMLDSPIPDRRVTTAIASARHRRLDVGHTHAWHGLSPSTHPRDPS
jgi:hypothetical protein